MKRNTKLASLLLLSFVVRLSLTIPSGTRGTAHAAEPQRPATIEWAPDGKVLVAANGFLARFDPDSDAEQLLDDTAIAFALQPKGNSLVAVATPDELALRRYPDFVRLASLPLAEAGSAASTVQALAWSPDGATLAGGTAEGHVLLWNVAPDKPAAAELWADLSVEPASGVLRLSFSADGKRLLSAFEDGRAVLWDLEAHQELRRFDPLSFESGEGHALLSMILSPDGRRVLATYRQGEEAEMALLDESGRVRWRRRGYGLEFTSDGAAVLALAPPFRIAALYRAEDAEALRTFEPPEGVSVLHAVRASPDGKKLVGVGEGPGGQVLMIWDFASARVLRLRR